MRFYGLLILLMVVSVYSLSKYDKEAQIRAGQEAEKEKEKEAKKTRPIKVPYRERMQYRPRSHTKEEILEDYDELNDGERRFPDVPALAYITPWNKKGYSRAEALAHKLTHVAPVWLQVKAQIQDGVNTCRIEGTHDIDHNWMEKLRVKNDNIKVIPRVLFDGWTNEELQIFFNDDEWNRRCLRDVNDFAERNEFDGIVLELWQSSIMAATSTSSQAADAFRKMITMIETVRAWGEDLHSRSLLLIVPIPPPIENDGSHVELYFHEDYWKELKDSVDYIQVMTHDYKPLRIAGTRMKFVNAPLDWVERNIRAVIGKNGEYAERVLIGLNHYGMKTNFESHTQDTVMGDTYIEFLKDNDTQLLWDEEANEHYAKRRRTEIYFPSLTSLEQRTVLAMEYGIGISIWDLGQGLNYFSRLL